MATRMKGERLVPYVLMIPALIILFFFRIVPTILGLGESFYITSFLAGGEKVFAGFTNFARLFADPVFWTSVRVTLIFNLITNPLQIILALGLAQLLNAKVKGINLFRSLYMIPVAISINVSTIIWKLMLDQNGLVNGILKSLGANAQPFFLSSAQSLGSVIWISSWIGVPFWALFLIAGIQGIPGQLYEAADIDGAVGFKRYFLITLPLLKNSLAFVLVAATVANFLLFIPVLLLTKGGPELSTNVAMFEAYRRGLIYGDIGTSSALVFMLFILILAVVMIQSYLLKDKWER